LTILALAFRRLREQIARRRESERALKVSKEHVELVNRELEAFNYAVAHDLRAPLRAIDGFSLAILEDSAKHLDEEGLEDLGRVRAAAQRMGLLIDGLLGLARVTRAELIREQIDLTRLARQSAALLQEAQPRSGVDVTVEEGLSGEGDIRLVTAVVDNLIGNAWKFTSKSPVTKIEVGKILQDGKPAFFVRDNGAGFDPAYSQKLFGAFQRLHATAEFEGSGIGLATVQRIIHRHGGRIWAEGAVGQGATFFFTL
jgi:light-regulated signal transduction histidine kinase (bacteriophytochrome)